MITHTLSTTKARAIISDLVANVSFSGKPVVIGRRNNPEVIMIPFPQDFNPNFSEITNINAYSRSFDFLKKEPEIYSLKDLKKSYV
jgi:hypothetical protein